MVSPVVSELTLIKWQPYLQANNSRSSDRMTTFAINYCRQANGCAL